MTYRVSQKACVKESNEKIVACPSEQLIAKYVTYGGHEPYSLAAILTCPDREYKMNFVLNTGNKTNQV